MTAGDEEIPLNTRSTRSASNSLNRAIVSAYFSMAGAASAWAFARLDSSFFAFPSFPC